MVAKIINITARVFQFIWTILIMALVGNMIATAFSGNPSGVNYAMFVSAFSMLSLFYLIPASFIDAVVIHPLIMVVLDVLNAIFFLCGGIDLAARLHVHSCGNKAYTHSNSITDGSYNTGKRCHEAQAVTAFLWFGFAAYCISAVVSGFASKGGPTNLRSGGIRRGPPAMSQV
ncbi:MAG: hypothetical protein M1819_006526 [Sarea resinae]|nr:MAG: hypothetical protein M1819_000618 [Sarea resinae]KAI9828819.1 MAG: hypothetical protein M1819_006526 [Sarea resinae]